MCFIQLNIADYLFLKTEFVFFGYEEVPALEFAELLAIMTLWAMIGYLLWHRIKKSQ